MELVRQIVLDRCLEVPLAGSPASREGALEQLDGRRKGEACRRLHEGEGVSGGDDRAGVRVRLSQRETSPERRACCVEVPSFSRDEPEHPVGGTGTRRITGALGKGQGPRRRAGGPLQIPCAVCHDGTFHQRAHQEVHVAGAGALFQRLDRGIQVAGGRDGGLPAGHERGRAGVPPLAVRRRVRRRQTPPGRRSRPHSRPARSGSRRWRAEYLRCPGGQARWRFRGGPRPPCLHTALAPGGPHPGMPPRPPRRGRLHVRAWRSGRAGPRRPGSRSPRAAGRLFGDGGDGGAPGLSPRRPRP